MAGPAANARIFLNYSLHQAPWMQYIIIVNFVHAKVKVDFYLPINSFFNCTGGKAFLASPKKGLKTSLV